MKNIDLGEFAVMPAYAYEILILNNNGGNGVETRHALSLLYYKAGNSYLINMIDRSPTGLHLFEQTGI